MARKKKTPRNPITEIGHQRVAWLEEQLLEVLLDIEGARACESWTAVAAFRGRQLNINKELDAQRRRLATLDEVQADAAELSPEEWTARVHEDAAAATEGDLEVYVSEWLSRRKFLLEVDSAGQMRLVRRQAG